MTFVMRSFAITGFYHRYFSHRSFRTSRPVQFAFALIGASAAQRGPLWWAATHRQHHGHADREGDPHSPQLSGFLHSHTLWFLCGDSNSHYLARIRDFSRYPELRWLDKHDILIPGLLALALFLFGTFCKHFHPQLAVDGLQLLLWGFVVPTILLYHITFSVNSICHLFGTRPYPTKDSSRNNAWLALITFGEAWHNNHHHYPASVRQGFRWYEIDLTYYLLRLMRLCGLVWSLREPPSEFCD